MTMDEEGGCVYRVYIRIGREMVSGKGWAQERGGERIRGGQSA
jgi:hypothetical protein